MKTQELWPKKCYGSHVGLAIHKGDNLGKKLKVKQKKQKQVVIGPEPTTMSGRIGIMTKPFWVLLWCNCYAGLIYWLGTLSERGV